MRALFFIFRFIGSNDEISIESIALHLLPKIRNAFQCLFPYIYI